MRTPNTVARGCALILEKIVDTVHDAKGRFAFVNEESRIRAQQGFSFKVNPELVYERLHTPQDVCIHGTYHRYMDAIMEKGLSVMGRTAIHCATGLPGTVKSGMRADCETAIYLNTAMMLRDGIPLYRSGNGVLLTRHSVVP